MVRAQRFLITAREEKGISQEELAKLSGVELHAIRRYESGKGGISLDTADKLCKALGKAFAVGDVYYYS